MLIVSNKPITLQESYRQCLLFLFVMNDLGHALKKHSLCLGYCGKKQIECGLAWCIVLLTMICIITVVKICCGLTRLRLMSRVSNVSSSDIPKLEQDCRQFFNVTSLFNSANLSVWAMGYSVPFHTKQLFEDLGVGLGINSVQGRESKHQQLASFASVSLVKHTWA